MTRLWTCALLALGLLLWMAPVGAQSGSSSAEPAAAPSGAAASRSAAAPASAAPASSVERARSSTPWVLNASLGPAPAQVHRETPRETISGFMETAREQDFARAAHYLNLSKLSWADQRRQGAQLAHELYEVLDNQVWFDLELISDDPQGGLDKTASRELQVASVPIKGGTQGIRLVRVADQAGHPVWVFSSSTVSAIHDLHQRYGPPAMLQHVPSWMKDHPVLGLDAWQWIGLAVLMGASWLFGFVVAKLAGALVRLGVRRRQAALSPGVTRKLERPAAIVSALVAFLVVLPSLRMSAPAELLLTRIGYIGVILAVTLAVIRLINHGAALVEAHSIKSIDEDIKRRAIATQVTTMRKIAVVLVVLVGIALALMQFPVVRTVGWSLLGSAGIAGAIIGFAAQKTFSNVFAGLVISMTQPIRIGDTVVVEKEYGVIEEIGTTHVVVKLWDLRRLVLPIVYFLEHPFENWTRKEVEMVGTVRVHADYRISVEEARAALQKMLEGEALWNGKAGALIVEELLAESVQLRISLSADNAAKLWDLRCKVREQMLAFLQEKTARIPVRRVENPPGPAAAR